MAALDEPTVLPRPRSARRTRPKWVEGISGVWDMLSLAARTLICLVTPPFSWRGEFVEQTWKYFKLGSLIAACAGFAFGYGAPGMQGTSAVEVFGDITRVGIIIGAAAIREQSVWNTGLIIAGAVGTAICADLGARKVRGELDALAVIGVDVVRREIAPRVLAMTLLMPALATIVIVTEYYGNMLGFMTFGGESGAYAEASTYFTPVDVVMYIVKDLLMGLLIGIVCCYKGITATGGPRGLGRAVNQAVVISFGLVLVWNYAANATYLSLFPDAQTLR